MDIGGDLATPDPKPNIGSILTDKQNYKTNPCPESNTLNGLNITNHTLDDYDGSELGRQRYFRWCGTGWTITAAGKYVKVGKLVQIAFNVRCSQPTMCSEQLRQLLDERDSFSGLKVDGSSTFAGPATATNFTINLKLITLLTTALLARGSSNGRSLNVKQRQ